jgi:hypothetical protein
MKRLLLGLTIIVLTVGSAFLFHAHSVLAQGTTYYVATNGSDSNSGTIDQPFATLNYALTKANAGDTVDVRGGTYYFTSGYDFNASGTASAHIVIQSYPGEQAILDGSKASRGTSADCVTVLGQYVDVKNFECRNAPRTGFTVWGGAHVQLLNNVVHDSWGAGIFVGYNQRGVVSDVLIDGNTVYHNVLSNSNPNDYGGGWSPAIATEAGSYVTYTNNVIYDNYGEGALQYLSDHGHVAHNTLHDNYSVELYMDNDTDTLYEKNFAYTTNDSHYYRFGVPASGIQMANESYGISNPLNSNTAINNIIVGGGYGFYYGNYGNGGGLKNTLIANNTFYGAAKAMVHIDSDAGHSNTTFANNIFYQTNGKPQCEYTPTSAITFKNNLWYGGSAGNCAGSADVNADPLLANPGTATPTDYAQQNSSPAIDAGTTLDSVHDDYAGTARPQGNGYDIGAFEGGNPGSGGGGGNPTPTPTPPPTPTPAPSSFTCAVTYDKYSDWGTGFSVNISITNTGSTPISGWSLSWTYSGDQKITSGWDANFNQNGQTVTVTNLSWNGGIDPGSTISNIGFNGQYSGTNSDPTNFSVNGVACK